MSGGYPGAMGEEQRADRGGLRAKLAGLILPQHELHAEEERVEAVRLGGTPIGSLVPRHAATVCGTLRSVTLRPRAGVPALEAELFDGTGSLALVWLGRRQIAGIDPGRRMRASGMVSEVDGRTVVFNPRYDLVPRLGD